jgi:presenilin-like A22 family membrane protease
MKGNANIFLQLGLIHRNAGYFLNNMSKNCPNLLFGSLYFIGYKIKSFKNFIIVYIFYKKPWIYRVIYYFSSFLVVFFVAFLVAFSSFSGRVPTNFA